MIEYRLTKSRECTYVSCERSLRTRVKGLTLNTELIDRPSVAQHALKKKYRINADNLTLIEKCMYKEKPDAFISLEIFKCTNILITIGADPTQSIV